MIHKYKLNGYNIVLDINSGGVHVVDELTYDLLDNVEPPLNINVEWVVNKLQRFYSRDEINHVMLKCLSFMLIKLFLVKMTMS